MHQSWTPISGPRRDGNNLILDKYDSCENRADENGILPRLSFVAKSDQALRYSRRPLVFSGSRIRDDKVPEIQK